MSRSQDHPPRADGTGLALDSGGQLVSALTAPKGARYTCLGCGGAMHVKRGKARAAHFAHDHEDAQGCGGESVTHRAAKWLLAHQLRTELEQNGLVRWVQQCPGMEGSCRMRAGLPQTHPVAPGWSVREEVAWDHYRFDVAVLVGDVMVFGFEVYHRHQVPEEKAAALGVPWLELVAEDLLEFKPRVPYRGSVAQTLCPECQQRAALLRQRAARDAARGKQTRRYEAEVQLVKHTWSEILASAGKMAERERTRRR